MDTQIWTHPGFIGGMAGCLLGIIGGVVGFVISYRKATTDRQKNRIVKFTILVTTLSVIFVGIQILAPAVVRMWSWGAYVAFMLSITYFSKTYLGGPENKNGVN